MFVGSKLVCMNAIPFGMEQARLITKLLRVTRLYEQTSLDISFDVFILALSNHRQQIISDEHVLKKSFIGSILYLTPRSSPYLAMLTSMLESYLKAPYHTLIFTL